MCGIAGIFWSNKPDQKIKVNQMVESMRYRGPDGVGLVDLGIGVIGHCRLSIIDLSVEANQPMSSIDGSYSIVFNGEIYNFIELREELIQLGFKFKTTSDTEVLLYWLMAHGKKGLKKLVGMFAGCFVDTKQNTFMFFRDNFGQKPLNYKIYPDGSIIFASEIKSILVCEGKKATPNFVTISNYLVHSQSDIDHQTFFEGIEQLEPGELMLSDGPKKFKKEKWYSLKNAISEYSSSKIKLVNDLRRQLENTTFLHSRMDVKAGLCLSGGLDSSALLALLYKQNLISPNFSCFSVEFLGEFSERSWFESAATQFGLETKIIQYTNAEFADSIDRTMWHLEGPIGGLMNCALGKIYETASTLDLTVLYDGTGIDEIFGGYQYHHLLFLQDLFESKSPSFRFYLDSYTDIWSKNKLETLNLLKTLGKSGPHSIDGTLAVRNELLNQDVIELSKKYQRDHEERENISVKQSLCEFMEIKKIPRNTRMKDRLSMAFSKELRIPFLDWRLAELGMSLPTETMFEGGYTKSLIREALKGTLKDDVRLSQKRSIQAPQAKWLSEGPMKTLIMDTLHSQEFRELELFSVNKCKAAYTDFLKFGAPNSFFIWQWLNMSSWFRCFQ